MESDNNSDIEQVYGDVIAALERLQFLLEPFRDQLLRVGLKPLEQMSTGERLKLAQLIIAVRQSGIR